MKDIARNGHSSNELFTTIAESRHIQNTLLPVHLLFDSDGNSITLPKFLSIVSSDSTRNTSARLNIGVSTVNDNKLIAIELLRNLYGLPILPITLDPSTKSKLDAIEREYSDYTLFKKLIQSKAYKEELPFLNKIIIEAHGQSYSSLMVFLQQRYGWNTDRKTTHELAKRIGKNDSHIRTQAEGGKAFLNLIFGINFSVTAEKEAKKFIDTNLVSYDRLHLAYEYLKEYQRYLLPIESFVLQSYLEGKSYDQIVELVRETQAKGNGILIASPGGVDSFLTSIFELRNDTSPFVRVWLAEQARKRLTRIVHDPFERRVLVKVLKGKSFTEIAHGEQVHRRVISEILERNNIEFADAFAFRKVASSIQRTELLQVAYLLSLNWPEKEMDITVLEYLEGTRKCKKNSESIRQLTFTQIANELNVTHNQVALSVSRIRVAIRREMYRLEEEKSGVIS